MAQKYVYLYRHDGSKNGLRKPSHGRVTVTRILLNPPAWQGLKDKEIYRLEGRVYQWFDDTGLYVTSNNGTRLCFSVSEPLSSDRNAAGLIIIKALVRTYGLS